MQVTDLGQRLSFFTEVKVSFGGRSRSPPYRTVTSPRDGDADDDTDGDPDDDADTDGDGDPDGDGDGDTVADIADDDGADTVGSSSAFPHPAPTAMTEAA